MTADPMMTQMLDDLRQSQQAFLELLNQADEPALYRQAGDDDWSAAMILVHISEARHFFAGQIEKIMATPGIKAGRKLDDPHRLQTIANHGHDSTDEIRRRLLESHQAVADTLSRVTAEHLNLPTEHVSYGPMSLAEFVQRLVVGHDQMHVRQVKALLGV